MYIKLLQAENGDAIHLRVKDEENHYRNILIDGGKETTYIYKNREKKSEDGVLKQFVEQIRTQGEHIDLLILTHVDDDHIGGILKWFADDMQAKDLIKKVWFNSGRLISEHFKKKEIKDNFLIIQNDDSFDTSIKQGVRFENYIEEHHLWDRRIIKNGVVIDMFGLKFTILSPSDKKLEKLLTAWKKDTPITDTASESDYSKSLTQLIASDKFSEDSSVPNGSSIAFMVENKSRRLMFLGDAHPQPVIDSLKAMGYSPEKPLKVDFMKLAHHGSKANTNYELLNLIKTENFLISSDSSSHDLPNKQCLARIIKCKKKVKLYFNYPELADRIFSKQDLKDFPDFKVCHAIEAINV
jgi:beta-lactamase superfamily II metal-dependent hydrolase